MATYAANSLGRLQAAEHPHRPSRAGSSSCSTTAACASSSRPPYAMREGDRRRRTTACAAPRRSSTSCTVTLDHERGGEIASRLAGHLRLLPPPPDRGPAEQDPSKIEEVSELLGRAARGLGGDRRREPDGPLGRAGRARRARARRWSADGRWDELAGGLGQRAERVAALGHASGRARPAPRAPRRAAGARSHAGRRPAAAPFTLAEARHAWTAARPRCAATRLTRRAAPIAGCAAVRRPRSRRATDVNRVQTLKVDRRQGRYGECAPRTGRVRSTDGPPPLPSRRSVPVLIDTTQLALERTISGAAQRHEALAANIANANTPGYQRVDVDFHGALAAALGSSDDQARAVETHGFTTQADASVGATQADGNYGRHRLRVGQARRQRARAAGRRVRSPRPASRSCESAMGVALMSMFGGMEISASALTASACGWTSRRRTSPTRRPPSGADGQPYRRKEVVLQEVAPAGGFGAQLSRGHGRPVGRRARRRPGRGHHRGPDRRASSSTTRATRTPTRRATCGCRTSTRSPRWST